MAKCKFLGCKNEVDEGDYCSECLDRFKCTFPQCKNKVEGGRSYCSECLKQLVAIEEDLSKNPTLEKLNKLNINDIGYVPTTWDDPIVLEVGVISIEAFENFVKPSGIKPKKAPPSALDVLEEALEKLHETIKEKSPKSKQPWKGILVAPELFFHRDETVQELNKKDYLPKQKESVEVDSGIRPHRCLDEEDFNFLVKACKELSKKFPQILIVPGSFLYRKSLKDKEKNRQEALFSAFRSSARHEKHGVWVQQKYSEDSNPELFFAGTGFTYNETTGKTFDVGDNVGIKDYKRDTIRRMLQKIGEYDYMIRNTAFGFFGGKKVFAYHKNGLNADINAKDDNRSRTVFVSGGMSNVVAESFFGCRIGMEICQDHDLGVLKKLHQGEDEVDLHIIASGHVDVRPDHVCASPYGFVIHADIKTDWNKDKGYSNVYQLSKGVDRKKLDDKLESVRKGEDYDEEEVELLEEHVVKSTSVTLETKVAQNNETTFAKLKLYSIALFPGSKRKKIE